MRVQHQKAAFLPIKFSLKKYVIYFLIKQHIRVFVYYTKCKRTEKKLGKHVSLVVLHWLCVCYFLFPLHACMASI